MKKKMSVLLSIAVLVAASTVSARTIAPIVSTDWLDANQCAGDLVIIDIRPAAAYDAGHIPGAINEPWIVPFSAWITMSADGLLLEMPADEDLIGAIGALGISSDSKVVVVGAPNPGEPVHYGPAGAARVALTLVYAGVPNVAVLDGGFPKWDEEGLDTTTAAPTVTPVVFDGNIDGELIASIDDVAHSLYRTTLVDARDADVYFGATIEPFADAAGHIPGAASLPGPWAYDAVDDIVTFRTADNLKKMAKGIVGANRPFWVPTKYKEVIVYCGVGGYGAIWTYVLTEVLGYRKVKFYDGSAQEWVATGNSMTPYKWER